MSNPHYFVGIQVPIEKHAFYQNLQQELELHDYYRRVTHPADLHCTLSFIGEVREDQLQWLREELSQIQLPGFTMKTSSIKGFGSGKVPRVVYAEVENVESLDNLEQVVWTITEQLGADRKSPYVPHITLAKRAKVQDSITFTGAAEASFQVSSFHLFQVHKGQSPSYEVIATFSLRSEGEE